jgi:hypothetical protein
MPLTQQDPLGIRPARPAQPPMMQRMSPSAVRNLGDPIAPEMSAPLVGMAPNAPRQRAPQSLNSLAPQVAGASPEIGNAFQREAIEPTMPSGIASIAPPPSVGRSEPPMAGAARALASRGRGMPGGPKDSMLVHMNPVEVQALADASPIGGLPINPDTGMPEAFAFLLPMLGGLAGSSLATAGVLGSMSALTAGAIGSGLGGFAQGMAQGESVGDSLLRGVIGGVGAYGLGSLSQAFSGADAAAGAIDPAATADLTDLAGAGGAPMAATSPLMQQAPMATTMSPNAAASFGGGDYGYGGGGMSNPTMQTSSIHGPANLASAPSAPVSNFVSPTPLKTMPYNTAGGPGPLTGGSIDPTGASLGFNASRPSLGNALKDSVSNIGMMDFIPAALPDVINPQVPETGSSLAPRKKKYSYTRNDPEPGDTEVTRMSPSRLKNYGRTPEGQHRFFQNRSLNFQEGGLVDAGIGSLDPEGEQEIVVNAKLAAIGRHPNPEAALMAYAERFGVEALKQLMRGVTLKPGEGEALQGQGGGMADLIPAVIDGEQPARLSSGEVVVPADVVSGVGDGDTEAGAARLKDMMAQIRMAKTGSTQQPMPIDEAMAQA